MADNSLRYRTNPVLPRSHPSSDDDAFDSGQEPGNDLINAGSDDPLAELARLVGQVDPFDDRRPPARPSRDPWEADDRSDPEYAARHLQAPPLADYRYGDPEEGDAQQGYAEGQSANWHTREHATYDEPAQAGGLTIPTVTKQRDTLSTLTTSMLTTSTARSNTPTNNTRRSSTPRTAMRRTRRRKMLPRQLAAASW